ncbi:MAG: hypothetical protein IT331_13030 [Anaerolineae bacterium]|nr:hypothetical protein [Anaerolineae bacterium]
MIKTAQVRVIRPRRTNVLVRRPRLVATLNGGLDLPVTYISAAAGFGKTTLLLEWLESVSMPAAWISLEESDDSLQVFATYLIAAIRTIFPGALEIVSGMLNSPHETEISHLAAALSDGFAELPEPFILVLDDYHLMQSPEIQTMMSMLLRQVPSSTHLVITARHDVPLPLAKLRATGQLLELRSPDLRFTSAETHELLNQMLDRDLSPEPLEMLQEAVEGWVTGIRFAALKLRAGQTETELLKLTKDLGSRHLTDYFLSEILLQQTPVKREFLLKTALLDRFNASGCEYLMAGHSGENWRAILDELVQDETMLVVLDESEGWYRYHHLFRDFLRTRATLAFDAGTIGVLHLRASQWNAAQGMYTAAIHHAIAAGDYARGAQLVGEAVRQALDQETARPLLEAWLRLFPAQEWDNHLGLVMAQIWVAHLQFRIPVGLELLPLADRLLEETQSLDAVSRKHYLGEIAETRMAIAFFQSQPERVIEMAPDALENLPQESAYARGSVIVYHANSLQMLGRASDGTKLLMDTFGNYPGDSVQFRLRLMMGLGWIHMHELDYHALFETATRMLELARDRSYLTLVWANYFLGEVNYEWNNLEAAAQHFAVGADLRMSSNIKPSHENFVWLALTQQAQGLESAAIETLHQVRRFSDETHSPDLAQSTEAYRARLALLQGDVPAALRWAETASLPHPPHMMWDMERHLTRLRVLLATHKPELVKKALTDANTLIELTRAQHNPRRLLQLYVLQALALDELGQTSRALDALQTAVEIGEKGDSKRTFIELGPAMTRLLSLLVTRKVAIGYVKRILASVPTTARSAVPEKTAKKEIGRLIEPLTWRELQVLEGLANHMTTKEIANSLVISPLTVKSHIGHIFAKLDVNSRAEAARVGIAYGLLEAPPQVQMKAGPLRTLS